VLWLPTWPPHRALLCPLSPLCPHLSPCLPSMEHMIVSQQHGRRRARFLRVGSSCYSTGLKCDLNAERHFDGERCWHIITVSSRPLNGLDPTITTLSLKSTCTVHNCANILHMHQQHCLQHNRAAGPAGGQHMPKCGSLRGVHKGAGVLLQQYKKLPRQLHTIPV
jgi:hypothetical protein